MKAIVKGLIIGGIIALIGVIILIAVLAVNGWSVKDPNFEMQTYTAEGDYTALEIKIGAGSVKTEFYDGENIVIEYPVSKAYKTEFKTEGTTLIYSAEMKRIIWFGTVNIPDAVVKLPNKLIDIEFDIGAGSAYLADGVYGKVDIDIGAGSFNAANIECANLVCEVSAGSAKINAVTCSTADIDISAGSFKIDKITCQITAIDVSAGSANIGFTGARSEYGITTDVSAGSCNVISQTGTTDKSIDVDVSAGSVNLSFEN